ncbi:hypothetical protein ES703_99650 [subsurface metagenome]
MIVQVTMLRNFACHPVTCSLENKQVKYSVVNRCSLFRFLAKLKATESIFEFLNQRRLGIIVGHPHFHVEKIARAGGFDRAGVSVSKH